MKKKIMLACLMIFFSDMAYANVFSSMVNILRDIAAAQAGINASQMDIDSQLKALNGYVTGNSGWGTYQFHDYQSYGGNAGDWQSVLEMANRGNGSGELGQMVGTLSRQFSIGGDVYNQSNNNEASRHYYALKSQTVLAARASSQLDYNKIQDQIIYQQMLQQQIEKTRDLKAAVDLSSRIQVEGNLIALQMLRQNALLNQQNAVNEQASIISAVSNAKFLTKINFKGARP